MTISGKKIKKSRNKVLKCLKIMQNASLAEIEDLIITFSGVREEILKNLKNSSEIKIKGKKAENELHSESKNPEQD